MVQVYGGWLTDAGSYFGKASRGILDLVGQALHTAQGGGGTDLVSTTPQPKTDYVAPALIAGGVVMVALMLTKKKRR